MAGKTLYIAGRDVFMPPEDSLVNKINSGEIIFFTGAGTSFESGLFTPADIITMTCKNWLPGFVNTKSFDDKECMRINTVVNDVQPELFYSVLLDCANSNQVLDMWRAFRHKEWEIYNKDADIVFNPGPNINHFFLVEYANKHHLPIFTVNYDTMFEMAASELGIPYKVYTHKDIPEYDKNDKVCICKLHGTIGEDGPVTPDMICTTLESISTYNIYWLEYIGKLLKDYYVCFLGYSGRDVDYFPNIRTMDMVKKSFWFTENDKDTIKKAHAIKSYIIDTYPSVFFRDKLAYNDRTISVDSGSKECYLKYLCEKYETKSYINEDMVWLHLMRVVGNIAAANACGNRLFKDNSYVEKLTQEQKIIYYNDLGVIYREVANFPAYRKIYRWIYGEYGHGCLSIKLNAKMQVISSYQMEIPQFNGIWLPKIFRLWQRPILLMTVMIRYILLLKEIDRVVKENPEFARLNSNLVLESRIRNMAIYLSLYRIKGVGHLATKIYKLFCLPETLEYRGNSSVQMYYTELKYIKGQAELVGNYSTVNSCIKYLNREIFKDYVKIEDIDSLISDIQFTVTQDISAQANYLGHSSEASMVKKGITKAVENDNVLNIVKYILRYTMMTGNFEKDLVELYRTQVRRIRPLRLRWFYQLAGVVYIRKYA